MSAADVENTFGTPVDLPDDGGAMVDYPIVEPLSFEPPAEPASANRPWLAVGLGILLVVQLGSLALQLRPEPAAPAAPAASSIPLESHPTPFLERTLRNAHAQFTQGLYTDVVAALEPMIDAAKLVGPARSLEVHLILARAHAELGHLEKAAEHRRLASLTAVGREDAHDLLAGGHVLDREGRHSDARRRYHELLCLVDPDSAEGSSLATLARQALGDSLRREALGRDDAPTLPGAEEAGGLAR